MRRFLDLVGRCPRASFSLLGVAFIISGVAVLTHSLGWALVCVGGLILLFVFVSLADEFGI